MRTRSLAGALATGLLLTACGSSSSNANFQSPAKAVANVSDASQSPAVNLIALSTGTPEQRITATIQAFYRATWQNQGAAACSLFTTNGAKGFMSAAHVAFPGSVNATTKCPQAMAIFSASIADQVSTLQDDGVSVQGDALNQVGVNAVTVTGDTATAQAPENVGVLISPKLMHMVDVNGRWLIDSSSKIGKTLPQIVAADKGKKTH